MHKRIGIIGGLSPESTVTYYLHITRTYTERFGDVGYPEIVVSSANLEQFHQWRIDGQWDAIAASLIDHAQRLQAAGADFGLIATNTMHKVFDAVQAGCDLPLLHIIDPVADAINARGLTRVGVLGTTATMGDGFYADLLAARGIASVVPDAADQETVHRIIVDELVKGELRDASRQAYLEVMERLRAAGAQGVVLGCTEIPLLVRQSDSDMPLFDTAVLHADAALRRAVVVN